MKWIGSTRLMVIIFVIGACTLTGMIVYDNIDEAYSKVQQEQQAQIDSLKAEVGRLDTLLTVTTFMVRHDIKCNVFMHEDNTYRTKELHEIAMARLRFVAEMSDRYVYKDRGRRGLDARDRWIDLLLFEEYPYSLEDAREYNAKYDGNNKIASIEARIRAVEARERQRQAERERNRQK